MMVHYPPSSFRAGKEQCGAGGGGSLKPVVNGPLGTQGALSFSHHPVETSLHVKYRDGSVNT